MKLLERFRSTVEYMTEHGIKTGRVPDEVATDRIEICENCPSNRFAFPTRQCRMCLCFMDVKTKLIFDPVESVKQAKDVKTTCPAGHWGEYEGDAQE